MKFKVVELTQGSPEWRAYRKIKITATDIAVIMGNSPYQTKRELFFEKISNEEPEVDHGKEFIFAKGHKTEELIRQEYFGLTGVLMTPVCMESVEDPDLFASLDGHYEEEGRIIEGKLVGKEALEKAKTKGEIPQFHMDQLQSQMLVSGYSEADYFCHDGKKSGVVLNFKADPEYQKILRAAALEFKKMIETRTVPELTDRDVLKIEDEELKLKFAKLKDLKRRLDNVEIEYELLSKELKESPAHVKVECEGVLLTKVITIGNVNYKEIPELIGVDLDQYRGPTRESWRLNFPKEA